MLSYKTDFGYSIGVLDPQVSILGMDFLPKLVFWADFSFMFGFGCLDTPSDPNPPS